MNDVFFWTSGQLLQYIRKNKWDPKLVEQVASHQIDGEALLTISKTDLLEFGFTNFNDRQRILKQIATLGGTKERQAQVVAADMLERFGLDDLLAKLDTLERLELNGKRVTPEGLIDFDSITTTPVPSPPPRILRSSGKASRPSRPSSGKLSRLGATSPSNNSISSSRRSSVCSTPFRGRDAATELWDAEHMDIFATPMDEPTTPFTTLRSRLRLNSTPEPSAPPRQSSKHRTETSGLGYYWRFDKPLEKTKAQVLRQAKERHEKDRARRELELAEQKESDPMTRKLRATFNFIDTDESGVVSEAELEALLKLCFPKYGAERIDEMKAAIMEECDQDHSGTISSDEFINSKYAQELAAPAEQAEARASRKRKLTAAFKKIDADASGQIDRAELWMLLKLIFPNMGPVGIEEYYTAIIQECDANNDGFITVDEFVNSTYANLLSRPAQLAHEQEERREKLKTVFLQADEDGTGELEHNELYRLVQAAFPDHDDRSLRAYFDVILSECDADNSGSIGLDEFTHSRYANLLAGVDMQMPPRVGSHGHISDSGVHCSARADPLNAARDQRNTKDLHMSIMGTLKRGDTPPPDNKSQKAWNFLTGKTERTHHNRGVAKSSHLASVSQENTRVHHHHIRDAQDVLTGTAEAEWGYGVGIMEKERRFGKIMDVFHKWDESSDISRQGSGFIEYQELRTVIQRFFNWSDMEADDNTNVIMGRLDMNADGKLDFQEFVSFVTAVTENVTAQRFDNLMDYLHNCIGDVSQDLEAMRRIRLLNRLFTYWDSDDSGFIEKPELAKVIKRYNGTTHREGDLFVTLTLSAVDDNSDGKLSPCEFVDFFQGLTYTFGPDEFDFMVYRFTRCVEHVEVIESGNSSSRAKIQQRAVVDTQLASTDLHNLLLKSKVNTPIILYGIKRDPSRAVEKCAAYNDCEILPFLVTHKKAEKLCTSTLKRCGFHKGSWIYIVLGSDNYDPGPFLREIGILLQTRSAHIHKKCRIWITAPYRKISFFPTITLMGAATLDLDDIKVGPRKATLSCVQPMQW